MKSGEFFHTFETAVYSFIIRDIYAVSLYTVPMVLSTHAIIALDDDIVTSETSFCLINNLVLSDRVKHHFRNQLINPIGFCNSSRKLKKVANSDLFK